MKHSATVYRSRVWAWWRQLLVYSFRVRVEFNNSLLIAYFKGLSFIFTIVGIVPGKPEGGYIFIYTFFQLKRAYDGYLCSVYSQSVQISQFKSWQAGARWLGKDGVLVILPLNFAILPHTFCFRDLWFNLYSLQIYLWVNMNRKLFIFSKQLVFWSVVDYGAYVCRLRKTNRGANGNCTAESIHLAVVAVKLKSTSLNQAANDYSIRLTTEQ